ncbi:MAG: hypothetical protein EXR54_03105 [Dehalococcoidia bacterium]|nr:hypothetical protein [Dehalococcoidia bacterium]MSQ16544.1 hypothetical protein [Dehalococcoidia bacterium]
MTSPARSPRRGPAAAAAPVAAPRASRLSVSGSVRDINDYYYAKGWTDGLPIIPPTQDLVLEMLEASPVTMKAEQVLGRLPPLNGTVTVEKVAVNSVMAGCKPDYFPVVLAAVKAVLQPQFNAGGITTTTGGAAPVLLVSGPIAQRLGINSGTAVFGSGHQANATIGRALRLTMRNLGGAVAETMEKSTHGWPGKYTMCFAENQPRCPWEPLHVALGYPAEASIVIVVAARGIHTMVESSQETGEGALETLVASMTAGGISGYYFQARGASPVVVLGPEHAAEIAASGYSRQDVVDYLFEHVRLPMGVIKNRGHYGARSWPAEYETAPDDFMVPLVADRSKFLVMVAGGDGRHSSWFPAWSATQRAVEVVEG